jgi:hypothetical protein
LAGEHVAIVSRWAAGALLTGNKRIETRFSRRKRPPFGRVRPGDTVHFKRCGGELLGSAQVSFIKELTGLTPAGINRLRRRYAAQVAAPATYWKARRKCRFVVLIWVGALRSPPRRLRVPRQYGGGWLVLRD